MTLLPTLFEPKYATGRLPVNILENISLQSYNSFGVPAKARLFCTVRSEDELKQLMETATYRNSRRLILGGGSNILFTRDFDGLVIRIELKGITLEHETDTSVDVKVAAGELWHEFVLHCVDNDWGGIENLSLIPGTAGAAPIQNIGAYGVEIADVTKQVDTIDAVTGLSKVFTREECGFEYRESAFKSEWKEKKIISSVTLTLSKNNHSLDSSYGVIKDTLKLLGTTTVSVKAISDAVIHIRKSKLPDHHIIGNAGSFFKNPTLPLATVELLQKTYPGIPTYPVDNQNIKVPAGWLIEQCGWKGKRINNIGVHPHQALVLVNYGGGTGEEILQLSKQIQSSVKEKFNVSLVAEVNIL